MRRIGVRELKEQASRVLHEVHERGETFEVTNRGQVVARLVPAGRAPSPAEAARTAAVWADMDQVAAEIALHWPKDVSGTDAVREQRREL